MTFLTTESDDNNILGKISAHSNPEALILLDTRNHIVTFKVNINMILKNDLTIHFIVAFESYHLRDKSNTIFHSRLAVVTCSPRSENGPL